MPECPQCPLCDGQSIPCFEDKFRSYFQCKSCLGVFVDTSDFVSSRSEKQRYETHNNDVDDPGYQKFVSPITDYVLKNFEQDAQGLDYGAGPGPVITKVLRDADFKIETHDPFFKPNEKALKQSYDYIVCCEVMEHFHHPFDEFEFLHNRLKPNGRLICMTDLFSEDLNFKKWYYKNDETHVFFYHKESLSYIKKAFGFSKLSINDRLIVFEK